MINGNVRAVDRNCRLDKTCGANRVMEYDIWK